MFRRTSVLLLIPLLAAAGPAQPARAPVLACHIEIFNRGPHRRDDIIEVADHRRMLACMALRGFIFQAQNRLCAQLTVQVDNPACYQPEKKL